MGIIDKLAADEKLRKKAGRHIATEKELRKLGLNTETSPEVFTEKPKIKTKQVEPTPKVVPDDDNISDDELKRYLDPQESYTPIAFEDAIDMLFAIFPIVGDGTITLDKWQIEEQIRLCAKDYTKELPLKYLLTAANGSGKDSFIIAPFMVFQAMCKVRSRTIVTASSDNQLSLQTEAYARMYASSANKYFEAHGIPRLFIIKKHHIVCTVTGSEIILFVTDDGGRAEGYHPFPDSPKGEVTIIINEAKTVPDIIAEHLGRCTFTRWIEVTSPGKTSGFNYKHYRESVQYPADLVPGKYYSRRISSFDCTHISRNKIEADKIEFGENSPIFRSKHLALYTSLDEQVVITKEKLDQVLAFPPSFVDIGIGLRCGVDYAGGGDECALYVFNNNSFVGRETFRARDTAEVTVPVMVDFFKKYGLKPDQIYGDDGGLGQPINDSLRRIGWPINLVRMQWKPLNIGQYGNRGAELWFRFGQIIQFIMLPADDFKLHSQLCSRYYKQHATQGKLILEAKSDARAKGHGSPDRADAVCLAFTGVTANMFIDTAVKPQTNTKSPASLSVNVQAGQNGNRIQQFMDNFMRGTKAHRLSNENKSNPGNILRSLYEK